MADRGSERERERKKRKGETQAHTPLLIQVWFGFECLLVVEVKIACRPQGLDVASSSVPFLVLRSQGLSELGKHPVLSSCTPLPCFHAFLVGPSIL